MLDNFKGFIGYDESEFKDLWDNALVVVDTNILIYFYKFSSKQSTSLFNILKKLKEEDRLWIPHQVALEYFHNYENNMYKQKEGYNTLRDELLNLKVEANKVFSSVNSTYPFIKTEKFEFIVDTIANSNEEIEKMINKEIEELPNAEKIKQDVLNLMEGIVGDPYTQKTIDNIQKEGDRRYKNIVPPGWKDGKDNSKDNVRTFGSIMYNQKYGDLILWNQVIDKAKEGESPTQIIFLTEEKKEDWWRKDKGIRTPQPNLINEFKEKTGQKFYMYRIDGFIKYASEHLGDSVTEQDVKDFTKELESIRKSDEVLENNKLIKSWSQANENLDKPFRKINSILDYVNKSKLKEENINIKKLMDYLLEEEKETFINGVNHSFMVDNRELSSQLYNDAVAWALEITSPRLMNKAIDLISTIGTWDYNKANDYREKLYDEMPEETIPKGIILLEFVEKLESEIRENEDDGLPF
ncbi:PIN-like domain-containing protein [Halobacillus halophilus]|uniref:PIN-like domain-containing protein n=1 Tax=Halobacillus halophilus TaxID=1570 RepID=UPI001CD7DA43|nr:PIN-like domain-containing protein [Halobacillus halophilus]MCA1011462.1 hypothetical protein [Halobacillus halophilus]